MKNELRKTKPVTPIAELEVTRNAVQKRQTKESIVTNDDPLDAAPMKRHLHGVEIQPLAKQGLRRHPGTRS